MARAWGLLVGNLLLGALLGGTANAQTETVLRFGVYSFKKPTDVYQEFRPAVSALQDAMVAEPGLGVLAVRARAEARIGREGRGGPLPDVAEHLSQAVRAVPGRMGSDLAGLVRGEVEVDPLD